MKSCENFEIYMKFLKVLKFYVNLERKKMFSSEIHVFRSDQFSLLMYRCLLLSSVTDYEENMEKACYATNDVTFD